MKKLLLVRHAKAAHPDNTADFERPLKRSGIKDATEIAQRLHSHQIIPQHIIASPALRTLTTANILAEHLGTYNIETNEHIYEASEGMLLQIITTFPEKHDFIALVGHNPDLAQTLHYLTGQIKDVVPGAVALIEFESDTWSGISMRTGQLSYYDEP